jgi:hypothetical protein
MVRRVWARCSSVQRVWESKRRAVRRLQARLGQGTCRAAWQEAWVAQAAGGQSGGGQGVPVSCRLCGRRTPGSPCRLACTGRPRPAPCGGRCVLVCVGGGVRGGWVVTGVGWGHMSGNGRYQVLGRMT